MAEKLTPQQKAAVIDRGGPLLVSAAAGSGKTKVLVDRLISYILDPVDPANIDDFLIITYTHAAAAELRGKIAAKLNERISENPGNRHLRQQLQRLYLAKISTVHSFCSELVKEYAYLLDVSGDFRVADENECLELQAKAMDTVLTDAYTNFAENPEIQMLFDSQGFGRDDGKVAEIILKTYTSARCHLDPNGWLDWCVSSTDVSQICDAGETIWGKYLIDKFRGYLGLQIDAMVAVTKAASLAENMEKPYLLLQSTVDQLQQLYDQNTWDGIREKMDIDYGVLSFSKKCDDPQLIERIKCVRNACKKGVSDILKDFSDSSDNILRDYEKTAVALRGLVLITKKFSQEYDRLKRARRTLDFSDLEHRTLDLLRGRDRKMTTKLAFEIGNRFHEVMVDEYQDSNAVQDAIFTALTAERGNCFMVGDVKQSIYQFRLADPGIFLEKYNNFHSPENAKSGEGRKILLSSNFRSGSAVIDAVNDVFYTCMSESVGGLQYTDDEALNVGIERVALNEPEIELCAIDVQEDTYGEESTYVAQKVHKLLDGKHYIRDKDKLRPIEPGDIVILLRSPGSVGGYYRRALYSYGISCASDKATVLLQEEEVSTLISLLQTINNPLQDISLVATMLSRVFMFTADDLANIRAKNKKCSFYEAVKRDNTPKTIAFLNTINQFRDLAKTSGIVQLISSILSTTKLDSIYGAMPDGETKVENIHAFCQIATAFESSNQSGLNAFISHLDVLAENGYSLPDASDQANCVRIMSIHKSKGLEFPVVILAGLSRDFNRKSATEQVLCDKDLGIGLFCVDVDKRIRYPSIARRAIASKILAEGMSEEMRVLYVAMTRASDRLIMTYASNRLEAELNTLAVRMNEKGNDLLVQEANCPGEWILLTALGRTESGQLFSLVNASCTSQFKSSPWLVSVEKVDQNAVSAGELAFDNVQIADENLVRIKNSLSYQYPHTLATVTPSKQTATQLKGRLKDDEVSQNTGYTTPSFRNWRKPEFIETTESGTVFGKLIHKVMQHIDISCCGSLTDIDKDLNRIVSVGYITPEEKNKVDISKIYKFFSSNVGRRAFSAGEILREFKFSILDDAANYDTSLKGEQILLQGVVDCAFIDDNGITVIDFKTDRVNNDNLQKTVDMYSGQVALYAAALSKIYNLPIKEKYIYFFHIDDFVKV